METETRRVEVPTDDGVCDAIVAAPNGGGAYPGVLMYMDAFGLRPRLEQMASALAARGYVVLVPNVFYRHGPAPVVALGDLADSGSRGAAFESLRPMMQSLTANRATRDAERYLSFLVDNACDAPVATVGYCMGGALALRTAAHAPDRVAAVASFHGGRLATDQPDSPHLLTTRVRGEVYVGHADHDASMPVEAQRRLDEAFLAAGVTYRAELYEGALHGFTMADTAVYDEAATERHWQRLVDLLGRNLRC